MKLTKYFLAHDHLKNASVLPLYLAAMENVKLNNYKLWKEFEEGQFCKSKINIKFTSIKIDHETEQEN